MSTFDEREVGTVLGLLPLGTANDFARTLQIPSDLASACETIARGKRVDVDLGLAGDNFFVNVASAGLSVGVTQTLSPPTSTGFPAGCDPDVERRSADRRQVFTQTFLSSV